MEKTRNITFDIAKGIGIILVVIGHYIPEGAPSWYVGFTHFIYQFHMPLFFIIAGFFFERSSSDKGYWSLVGAKFKRLMIPYFILSWAVIVIKILSHGKIFKIRTMLKIALNCIIAFVLLFLINAVAALFSVAVVPKWYSWILIGVFGIFGLVFILISMIFWPGLFVV